MRPLTPIASLFLSTLTSLAFVRTAHGTDGNTYAIVVGHNGAIDDGPALQYADDDALKWAAVLGMFADDVTLLTDVDAATASQWDLADHGASLAPPTRTQLRAAFERYNRPNARIIYVHVGHGRRDVDDRGGEAFLKMAPDPLADPNGRLYRSDLRAELVDRLAPTARLDLIIDACDAYHLVRRGDDPEAQVAAALAADDLATRPNVGVVLATRGAWQVNESKELEGSYFSLVLRSALLGSADPDLGGVIRYSHIDTALRIAGRIHNRPRERFEPWVAPPEGRWGAAFIDWGQRPQTSSLRLGADVVGHVQVYDSARGLWASFGKARGHEVRLRGVRGRAYHVHSTEAPGRVWLAGAPLHFEALTRPTPYVANARGDATSIYQGLLHCKTFEGYALASDWPAPTCDHVGQPSASPVTPRLSFGYQIADAPLRRLALSHGVGLAVALPVGELRVGGALRAEVARDAGATPWETIWGFGLAAGIEWPLLRIGPATLGPTASVGWSPLFLVGATQVSRWTDAYVEAGLTTRVWLSSSALVLTAGASFDVRNSDATPAVDTRWLVRLGLEVGP